MRQLLICFAVVGWLLVGCGKRVPDPSVFSDMVSDKVTLEQFRFENGTKWTDEVSVPWGKWNFDLSFAPSDSLASLGTGLWSFQLVVPRFEGKQVGETILFSESLVVDYSSDQGMNISASAMVTAPNKATDPTFVWLKIIHRNDVVLRKKIRVSLK